MEKINLNHIIFLSVLKKLFQELSLEFSRYMEKIQNINKIIPYVIKNCKENKKFKLTNGKQTRDFCYIDDVVNAILKILNEEKSWMEKLSTLDLGNILQLKIL